MTRYPTALPDFTRLQWVSDDALQHWQPIITAIGQMRGALEKETVFRGKRAAGMIDVAPESIPDVIVEAADRGAVAFPVNMQVGSLQRMAIVTPKQATRFRDVWQQRNDSAIGELLGFPACCRAFFDAVWIRDRRVDTTWQQASTTDDITTVDVHDYFPETNVMGRWLGIRHVPHLPCSFTCARSVLVAADWRDVAVQTGHDDLWQTMDHITRWPMEWSAVHGIGQVITPVWTMITRTDATAERLQVRLLGTEQPDFAARGLVFPYPQQQARRSDIGVDTWSANGFTSRASMQAAHAVIVRAVKSFRPVVGSVLDLGCGNGALVRRLATGKRGGVEADPARHRAAVTADPTGSYVHGDIRDPECWPVGPWQLTVCMIGRLLEGDTALLRAVLRFGPVVFYAYRDWLQGRHIDTLLGEAGQADRPVLARAESDDCAAVVVA